MNIHSFSLNGMHILVDVNSGAVHVVDEMISDIMNVFDGGNDEEVLASLAEQYSEDELREWARAQIAHFKVPRHFRLVDEFPMTVTGKVQKFRMREISIEELTLARQGQLAARG